jgi:hypothetical protein
MQGRGGDTAGAVIEPLSIHQLLTHLCRWSQKSHHAMLIQMSLVNIQPSSVGVSFADAWAAAAAPKKP